MLNFDYRNIAEPLRVFLCKPDNSIVCELNGVEPNGSSLKINNNNQYELEFDYYKFINSEEGLVESNGYDNLLIGMKLFLENVGYFKMKYPPYTYDGTKEYKHISANSIDTELEDKDLVSFKINTGEKTSFEYLVEYHSGETEELLNPYTGIPYDYIVFYNTFSEQLAALKEKYNNNATITNAEQIAEIKQYCNLIPRLVNKPIKDENGKIVQTIDENDNIIYSFDTYVTFNYNNDKSQIISIVLTNFHDRIDELCDFYDRETGYGKQLSLLDLAIENSGSLWTVGDIDSSLMNKRCQFDIDGQNIYSFLTQDIAQQSKCIAKFDYINYKINYISVEKLGTDSGVIIDKSNLLNNLSIDIDEDNIVTRFNVSGGNDLNLLDVNFGSNRIINIDYYLNSRDKSGKRIYVSDTLATKYEKYKSDVEVARTKYIEVAKQQRQAQKDIDEIKYRVPNDIVQNDWGTFKLSELEAAETHYNNLVATLQALYREDYPEGINPDDSINETFIRTTPYWHDYCAYKQALTQIGYAQYAINHNTTYKELTDDEILTEINAWETEWSLFGTVELENKIAAYNNSLNVMLDAKTVLPVLDGSNPPVPLPKQITIQILDIDYTYNSTTNKITFNNAKIPKNCTIITIEYSNGTKTITDYYIGDGTTKVFALNDTYSSNLIVKVITTDKTILDWDGLSPMEETQYAGKSEYDLAYDKYMKILKNRNSCQAYLDYVLQPQLEILQQSYNTVTAVLNSIKTLVAVKTYNRAELHEIISSIPDEDISFTDSEITIITNLYVDHNYSNENILMTSIDDIVSVIDIEQELLEDAKEQLSIESQPQFKFTSNIDNLLCMPEFKNYDFVVGNYILLEYYDDYYIQLRLDTIQFNPFAPEESLNVTYTNYIKSSSKRNDVSYILGENSGSSSGSSGSGGGSGSGAFGESDKIDVTISNTMLAKLLNTEMFASRVSNVILDTMKLNNLNAKHATFGSLASGTTTIDGACIETGSIISTGFNKNSSCKYNGTVTNVTYNGEVIGKKYALDGTVGSVINLYDGTFSFGGGKLKYDGSTLALKGSFEAGSDSQTKINTDGSFSFGGGKLTFDNTNGLLFHDTRMKLVPSDYDGELIDTSINISEGTLFSQGQTLGISFDFDSGNTIYTPYFHKTKIGNGELEIYYNEGESFNESNSNIISINGQFIWLSEPNTISGGHSRVISIDVRDGIYSKYDIRTETEVFARGRGIFGNTALALTEYSLISASKSWFLDDVEVSGTIYDKNGSVVTGSDINIKNSIENLDISKTVEFIYALNPIKFKYNEGTSNRYHHGLLAQPVHDLMYEDWGLYCEIPSNEVRGSFCALRYEELIPDIITVLQHQKEQINLLNVKIQELEGE